MERLHIRRRMGQTVATARGPALRRNQIIHALGNYNELLGEHLLELYYHRLTPGSANRLFLSEVGQLQEEGWIESEAFPGRRDRIYWLGQWGRVLQTLNGRRRFGNRRLLWDHSVLTADVMVSINRDARTQGGWAEWWGEYESWLPAELRPDAIGGVTLGRDRLDFFLEADTGSETQGIIDEKARAYTRYYQSGEWLLDHSGDNFPAILVVTSVGRGRVQHMAERVQERMEECGVQLNWFMTTESQYLQAENEGANGILHAHIWTNQPGQPATAVWM